MLVHDVADAHDDAVGRRALHGEVPLGEISRRRSGSLSESECETPLWSVSGATTQTSSESWRAIALQGLQARRMDAVVVGAEDAHAQACVSMRVEAAHVGLERRRDRDAAVLVLVVLQDRDERAADRDAGAVEGVDEARALAVLRPVARVHAPRLEVGADRAARDLAIGALPRQPDLDVVGLGRGEAHVAGAERHGAERQVEPLQDVLGAGEHALVLVGGGLGRGDRDELAFHELVLAQHAARVAPGGAGLRRGSRA